MLDERGVRTPSEFRILFEGNNAPCQSRGEGGFVSCTGTDNQHFVSTFDLRCLQQTGDHHRLHEIAASTERQILIDVGDHPQMVGDEELAPNSAKGVEHSCVDNLVRPQLALDHVGAGRAEFGHRLKPANQLTILYRYGEASTTGPTETRLARQPLDWLCCSQPGKQLLSSQPRQRMAPVGRNLGERQEHESTLV